jgi:acetyl esterase/lipase
MKYRLGFIVFIVLLFARVSVLAQNVVELPIEKTNEAVTWDNGQKTYYSDIWNNEVTTNVSKPTLTIYQPEGGNPSGASVIICPGGGLYALSTDTEGRGVAKALNEAGITAFVLLYRLVPTGEDGVKDLSAADFGTIGKNVGMVLPLSVDDAHNAIEYVRSNAQYLEVDPSKIGLMGFSAGGAVTMEATYTYDDYSRPNFIAPVYPWMTVLTRKTVPADAPRMFVVCSTDDPLGLATGSVEIYGDWVRAGISSELHMYAKGGHGYGVKVQELPSDTWVSRFIEWMEGEGISKSSGD